jgi:hypothetical protein
MPLTTLTIDYSVFYNQKNNFDILYSTIGNIEHMLKCFDPKDKYSKGVIFCIPHKILNKFEFLSVKAEKGDSLIKSIKYLNSKEFVDKIFGYSIFITNEEVIEVDITYYNKIAFNNLITASSLLLKGKNTQSPAKTPVRIYYHIEILEELNERKIRELAKFGFYDISVKSPLFYGKIIPQDVSSIYLIKNEDISYNTKQGNSKIYHILSGKINLYKTMIDSPFCYINIRIGDKTKKILREMVHVGGTKISNGNPTQRELSGCFVVKDFESQKGSKKNTFKFSLDDSTTKCNKEEDAEITPCKYNFHTHPYRAYINNNTKYAWPSCSDYKAFLVSFYEYGTIFHILASLEGLYIISVSKEWINNENLLSGDTVKFIERKYDMIQERNIYNPDEYIEIIKGFGYKNRGPIFNVEYERYSDPWRGKKLKNTHQVFFPKKEGKCII